MSTLNERLREERDRLKKTQDEFGRLGGVTTRTQANYEAGPRTPDGDYLANIAKAGVDVLYVITGVRGEAGSNVHSMNIRAHQPQKPYVVSDSDQLEWKDVIAIVIDELVAAGLTLPGEKVVRLTDLLMEYQQLGVSIDHGFVGKQIRLVA